MRTGNTTEREAPWKLELRFDRLKPPKWKRPYLVWLHLFLKIVPLLLLHFGTPGYRYIEGGKGYLIDNIHAEFNAAIFTIMVLIDFFVTKDILGPKLTGLHHGFKMNGENKITYHFYAEKDFLTRYPAIDRDSFFTFLVIFSAIWIMPTISAIIILSTRYYQQWTMPKFFAAWLHNFFMRIEYAEDDSGSSFGNAYRARY
ncbi:hypothetical protein L5515_011134 [Caenorhabditis briggsae]|uniref:Golgi apparatus membrane protein TVP23 homolog n=1 Tax=Caenorhabditis briggsae TaxID=6238 RepID=A0AAE9EU37_CAEBR|nr:hypothetical protein L5515_011134 [Caenorhabditis briggsae]